MEQNIASFRDYVGSARAEISSWLVLELFTQPRLNVPYNRKTISARSSGLKLSLG